LFIKKERKKVAEPPHFTPFPFFFFQSVPKKDGEESWNLLRLSLKMNEVEFFFLNLFFLTKYFTFVHIKPDGDKQEQLQKIKKKTKRKQKRSKR